MKEIIKLLQENNRLLQEINNKLSVSQNVISSDAPLFRGLSKEMILSLAEQYTQNPDIVINEDAVATVSGGNLFITSQKGRVNLNLSEKTLKSSFIKSIAQKGKKILVTFKTGKTYQYTSMNNKEFNRVADLLLTSTYVSHPFLQNLRDNPEFNYEVV